MKYKYFIFLLFIATYSNAQIAGYFGKRAVITYSNYFMIGFKGPGAINSAATTERSPTLNNVHCLNLEYVYKQNKMVCLSGQYLRTGIAYDNGKTSDSFFGDTFRSQSDYPYPGSYKYVGDYSKPALLRAVNFSLGIKRFRKGFIPPVGRYRKMEVLLLFEKIKYDYQNFGKPDPSYSYDGSHYILTPMGTGEYSYRNISFACTFGNQRVLNDKIVLDYGIRIAYGPALNIITLTAGDEFAKSTEHYYRRESNLRVAREQLVNFHLGIGFLAF
ncbi:hypothetical protein BH10BAC1_BH10BAC1_13900 [soil metagenome]